MRGVTWACKRYVSACSSARCGTAGSGACAARQWLAATAGLFLLHSRGLLGGGKRQVLETSVLHSRPDRRGQHCLSTSMRDRGISRCVSAQCHPLGGPARTWTGYEHSLLPRSAISHRSLQRWPVLDGLGAACHSQTQTCCSRRATPRPRVATRKLHQWTRTGTPAAHSSECRHLPRHTRTHLCRRSHAIILTSGSYRRRAHTQ